MLPTLLYGTAWKEERTEALVVEALAAGFRGVDTANQRRHYNELAVGAAIRKSSVPRDQLFLQTKYTYAESQDSRIPYDRGRDYPTQVEQSFASSIQNLQVESIDSYLLHGPQTRRGLSSADREVWRAMEGIQRSGQLRLIGVSNATADQLELLCDSAEVKPSFVQNRCFARTRWDRAVREVCRREGVVYQGFSLLTANSAELQSREIREIAHRHQTSVTSVVFSFVLRLGMICLTGTTNPQHMREDLAASTLKLSDEEIATIEHVSG